MITKIKIGKRNFKTAVAVFLSVLISKFLKLEYPFFTTIAAIFSMENSMSNSFRAGKNRLLGTLIGASVGVVLVSIKPGNAFLCGIGTIILIYLCNLFNWNKAVPIAGVVFASIMLSLNKKNPVQYSFSRVIDTLVGIVIAVTVNYLIFPPDYLKKIYTDFSYLSDKVNFYIRDRICLSERPDLMSLRSSILALVNDLHQFSAEFKPGKADNDKYDKIKANLELYRLIYDHMEVISELSGKCSLSSGNQEKLRSFGFDEITKQPPSGNDLDIVYNYHIGKILDLLQNIQPL